MILDPINFHVEPSKRSVQRLKDRVKQLADRRRCPVPLVRVMNELNASLRGWTGYFHQHNSSKIFRKKKIDKQIIHGLSVSCDFFVTTRTIRIKRC